MLQLPLINENPKPEQNKKTDSEEVRGMTGRKWRVAYVRERNYQAEPGNSK